MEKPRPLHKLNLKPGDTVTLMGWQNEFSNDDLGETFTVNPAGTHASGWSYRVSIIPIARKGQRPLFVVTSRAAAQPVMGDQVFTLSMDGSDHRRLTLPTADGDLIPGTYTGPGGAQIKIEVM